MIDPVHAETGNVTTTKGDIHVLQLKRVDGSHENEDEHVSWIEFYHEGELVHRSVHVTLKQSPAFSETSIASFG